MTSIKKNFMYNFIYQILILILPLITAPYIARVIGVHGTGIYSYTYSIATYFLMFAMLGLENYGNRTIAKIRENKEELSRKFSSIYFLQLITSLICTVFYILYVTFFVKENQIFFFIQLIFVASAMFDITWFFAGIEKFKIMVIRNIIIKTLSTLSVFIFVKTKNDLNIYILILALSNFITHLTLFVLSQRYVKFQRVKIKEVWSHFKPCAILFIPVISVSLYKIMDKIMLGNMTDMAEVGYYEFAEKIIGIPIALVAALGTVMLPRISNLIAKGKTEESNLYIEKSIQFSTFLAAPMVIGLIIIGKDFATIYFGETFITTGYIIEFLAITILFLAWNTVIRKQYLIPKERDKEFTISVALGAITNIILNLLLIGKYRALGAAIGTIFAELVVVTYQICAVKDEIPIIKYIKNSMKFIITAIIMGICIKFIHISDKLVLIIVQIVMGGMIYCILNIKYIFRNLKFLVKDKKIN